MKKLTLTLCALTAVASAAFAGTETYSSSKETKQMAPAPCPSWYADNEFNVTLSGVYAPTVNEYRDDQFLGVDHSFGGAIDIKYFFRRYFGLGVQGFGLALDRGNNNNFLSVRRNNNNNDFAAGGLGTFTFRYPIPCSRFAPYGWVGAGGVFNGNDNSFRNNVFNNNNNDGRFMGQYGAGFEVRFTPHFGLTNDVSYNQLEGGQNDFIQVRTGLNFAF